MKKHLFIIALLFLCCLIKARAATSYDVKEVRLELVEGNCILSSSFDHYPDDYVVKIKINSDEAIDPSMEIGSFGSITGSGNEKYLLYSTGGNNFV